MNFFSSMRACALATAILMIMIACSNTSTPAKQEEKKESVIEQIQKRGVLRVGMSTFVPWAMKDKTGNLIGFEIDVAKRLAKDTGVCWACANGNESIQEIVAVNCLSTVGKSFAFTNMSPRLKLISSSNVIVTEERLDAV